ncbi:MAG: hypothetical protein GY898_31415 [Proteobacteria bacterium]|nr:hypothetical protein [Pseudomonadota bacterium]
MTLRLLAALGLAAGCSGGGVLPSEPTPPPPPVVCGDGVVEGDEVCDDGVNDALDGGCLPGCDGEDLYYELFARDVLEVELIVDPADWDALRHERKTRHSVFGTEDCRTREVVNPYTWYPGEVTIDGETAAGAGLRKKGHLGSQSTLLPSIKLKFDEFEDGGRLHTMKRLALNNSRSDRSYLRTCSAYTVFRAAGIPAPECTWAHVSLNGETLGMYVATEEIKKPFLKRRLPEPDGTLYEGTACDWRPEFLGGFEQESNLDDDSRADLNAIYDAIQTAPDGELEAQLEPWLDLDAFYRFWAVETVIWHRDGYSGNANNYFLYADPARDGRLVFLPWGPDGTFRVNGNAALPNSVLAYGVLTNRLYAIPASRQRFYTALTDVLEDVWDPASLVAEGARVQAAFAPYLTEPEQDILAGEVLGFVGFVQDRRAVIEAAAAGNPDWTAGLRFNPCRIPLGPIEGTFATTYGTLDGSFFTSGTSTLTYDGEPMETVRAGSRAGMLGDGRTRVQLRLETPDDLRYTATFTLAEPPWFESYTTPGDHDLGMPPLNAIVVLHDIAGDSAVQLDRFDATEGTWTFDSIETTPDGAVVGSFSGTLWDLP